MTITRNYHGATVGRDLIVQNTPNDGSPWEMECSCGETLSFRLLGRGTPGAKVIVGHGHHLPLEITLMLDAGLRWSIGLSDPVGDWIERAHDTDDRIAGVRG